jgi:hypothetical protein
LWRAERFDVFSKDRINRRSGELSAHPFDVFHVARIGVEVWGTGGEIGYSINGRHAELIAVHRF